MTSVTLIEQGLTSHQTHYTLYIIGDDFYRSYDQTNSVKAHLLQFSLFLTRYLRHAVINTCTNCSNFTATEQDTQFSQTINNKQM